MDRYVGRTMPLGVLRVGDRLGAFELVRRIAIGGMAEIWSAHQHPFGESVALKIMMPSSGRDPEFKWMFRDEVRLARRLRHPNILQVFSAHEVDDFAFLAMELIDGINLRRLLLRLSRAEQWMPVPLALRLGHAMAAALSYAHTLCDEYGDPLHIVHRDVSPDNVMIARDGSIKLLDFGIAHTAERLAQTRTGVVKGKISYMAPEQALATEIGPSVDIFAVGIVLWETLAMQRLFHGSTDAETIDQVVRAEIRLLRQANPVVPRSVEAFIHRMLARRIEDRPASMEEVELTLFAILSSVYAEATWSQAALHEWIAPYLDGEIRASQHSQTRRLEEPTIQTVDLETHPEPFPASLDEVLGQPTQRVDLSEWLARVSEGDGGD